MDFTLQKLGQLLVTFKECNYKFVTLADYISNGGEKVVILRHDIDNLPQNALNVAKIENKLDVKGTYYFRIVKKSFNVKIITNIKNMKHEIGYHYEDIDLMDRSMRRNGKKQIIKEELIDLAFESFFKKL